MSSKEKVLYSSIGFCSIMDENRHVMWSVNKNLFKKISTYSAFVEAHSSANNEAFECYITYEGVKFKIKGLPLPSDRLLCIAFPEECYIRYAYSEMYMRIFNIKRNASRCVASMNDVKEALIKKGGCEDIISFIDETILSSEEIKYDASGISDLFDLEHMCDYVLLKERLDIAFRQVKKYNAVVNRNVLFDANFSRPVAKINYDIFETAIFEIVRILYKSIPEGDEAVVKIFDNNAGNMEISVITKTVSKFDVSIINNEIRDIKCMVECLSGRSSICMKRNNLVINAEMPVFLSNFTSRVKPVGYWASHFNELKGYSRIIAPEEHKTTDHMMFSSYHQDIKISLTNVVSEIMFYSFIEE